MPGFSNSVVHCFVDSLFDTGGVIGVDVRMISEIKFWSADSSLAGGSVVLPCDIGGVIDDAERVISRRDVYA